MAASQGPPTCERELNLLVDLEEEGLPEKEVPNSVFPQGLPQNEREAFVKRKKLVARKALTEWPEQLKVVEAKISRRTKRVDCLTNEIYQLVGLYSVFVGVVFTAVQADRVKCQHVWSPIVLCLLPSLIVAHIIEKKLVDIRRTRKDIALDDSSRKVHLRNLGNLKAKGYLEFDFSKHAKEPEELPLKDHESITRRGVILTLLISSVVTVGSFLHILCFTKSDSFSRHAKMTTCYTKVANESGKEVVLKLSNAGVHIKVKAIKNGECYTITSEPNATYREYWVGEVEGTPIVFSSDDCLENEEIIIKNDGEFKMNKRSDLKVVNTSDTEFKVTRRGGNGTPDVIATLKKDEECRIAYDSETKDSFSVESSSTLDERPLPIKPEDFVKSTKLKIVSDKPGNAKLRSAESRPAPATASTCSIL